MKDCGYNWNVGSGLNDLTLSGHCCFGSIKDSGDFSSQDWTLVCRDYCWALKRPHSLVQEIIVELETLDTSQTHDLWLDNKYNLELKIDLGWLTGTGSLVFKTFSLLARFAILASAVMNDSMEWRPLFQVMEFEFLEFSLVGSHWMVFSARFLNKSHPSFSSFCKNPPWHMVSKRILVA